MKKCLESAVRFITVLAFAVMATWLHAIELKIELLEYEVKSIDTKSWVVTVQEIASGRLVKFRVPPEVFEGRTFEANLEKVKPGQRFSVRGPRNARLNQMIMKKPTFTARRTSSVKQVTKRKLTLRRKVFASDFPPGNTLTWEVLHLDGRRWIATAMNRKTNKKIKFRVHAKSFIGYRFRAGLQGISTGQGFTIVTPNIMANANSCTLLKVLK